MAGDGDYNQDDEDEISDAEQAEIDEQEELDRLWEEEREARREKFAPVYNSVQSDATQEELDAFDDKNWFEEQWDNLVSGINNTDYDGAGVFGIDPSMDGGWHNAPTPGGNSPANPTQTGGNVIDDILGGGSNTIDIPNRKYGGINPLQIYGMTDPTGILGGSDPSRPTVSPIAPTAPAAPAVNPPTLDPIDTTDVDVTTPTPGDPDVQVPTTTPTPGTDIIDDILTPGDGTGTGNGDGTGDGSGSGNGDGDGDTNNNGGNNVPEVTPYQNQYITGDPQNKILPWAISDQPNMDTYLNSVMDMEEGLNPRQVNQMQTDYGAMTGQDMSGGIGDRDDQILAGILGQADMASSSANELRSGAGQLTEEELRRLREQAAAMAQGRGMVNSPAMMQDMLDRTSEEQYRMRSQDTDRALQQGMGASGMYSQAGNAQTNILNGILGVGNQIGIDPSAGIDIAGADMGNYFGLESANRLAHASEQQGKIGLGMDLLGMGLDYFGNRNQNNDTEAVIGNVFGG